MSTERDFRWNKIRDGMKRHGIDCLIVYQNDAQNYTAVNLKYLADFQAARGYMVFPLDGEPTLLMFGASRNSAIRKGKWLTDIRVGHPLYDQAIVDRLGELGLLEGTIGIVSADTYFEGLGFPHSTYLALQSKLGKKAKLVDASSILEDTRLTKSDFEIGLMENAAKIGYEVIDSIKLNARIGESHKTVRKKAIEVLYDNGAEISNLFLYSFGSEDITHGGSRAQVSDWPSDSAVKPGQVILTEFSVELRGYIAQFNQPFVVGKPSDQWQRLFDDSLAAYRRGYSALKPGLTAGELDDIVFQPIISAGYTPQTPPFHGIGLSIEQPIGTFRNQPNHKPNRTFVFRENMLIELEPHLATSDLKYGMSLGDTLLVTRSGCRRLAGGPEPAFIRVG